MLRFDQVNVHIEAVHVLRDVTISIEAGSTVALVGRNGAGKTTTLRTVMGLLTPTSGRVQFDGADITDLAPHKRPGQGIGYSPEDRRLFSAFSVEGNLLLPAQVAKLPTSEIERRLERVYQIVPGLEELKDRPARSVSGGQGKMVALGRALMIGTRLILLDEPFQGLAPALARRYADALRRLRDRDPDLTLIVTESNPTLLEQLVDVVYTIERGEIVKDGENDRPQV